jgi:Uma2 family endonuclease
MITTESTEPPAIAEWLPSPLYRMTVDQYESLVESGTFTKRDRLHLINGLLVAKMTQGDGHVTADILCGNALSSLVPAGWHVRPGKPVRIAPRNEPEPDHTVVRGAVMDYRHRKPVPTDVAMVVEVADSSLLDDRQMASVYGGAGIPIYWIVNLVDHQIEVYSGPQTDGNASRVDYKSGDLVPVVVGGTIVGQLAVDDIIS